MADIRKKDEWTTALQHISQQKSIAPTEDIYKRNLMEKEEEDDLLQFLSFIVDDEEYALELNEIIEVIKMREATDVPNTPSFIVGIISLRGEIISMMNLQKRLGLKDGNVSPATRIVITSYLETKMGFIVDKILGVIKVNPKAIEPPPPIQAGIAIEFIRGVVHHKNRLIILLNLPMFFNLEEA